MLTAKGTGPTGRQCHYYPPFVSIAKGEVFVLLYVFLFVFLFVRSTISRQPAGRFTQKFACWRTLVADVSSPLLGVGGPRRAEKGGNEIFVTIGVNGELWHFGGLSATRGRIHSKFYVCRDNVCRRAPLPLLGPSARMTGLCQFCCFTDALVLSKLTRFYAYNYKGPFIATQLNSTRRRI